MRKFLCIPLISALVFFSYLNSYIMVGAYSINNENIVNKQLLDAKLCDLPSSVIGHSTVIANNTIYTIGGEDSNGNPSNQIYMFDEKLNTWETKAPMPTPKSYFATEVVGDFIYCIGGIKNQEYLNVVEVYDTKNNVWTTKESMPNTRARFSTGMIGNFIYCIAGKSNTEYFDVIDIYDITKDSWESDPTDKQLNISDFSSAAIGNNIYIIGGHDDNNALNTVHIYNIENKKWSIGTEMPTSRSLFSTILKGNNIYCIGGLNSSGTLDVVEVYNTTTNNWTIEKSIPLKLHSFSSCYKNGIFYMFGGANENALATPNVLYFNTNNTSIKSNSTSSSNIDVYIVPQNTLSMSLSTNSVSFEDFDGVEDMEFRQALDLYVESTLSYDLYASLESEISNQDGSLTLDKLILSIKESSSNSYQNFSSIKTPILLKDNVDAGENVHNIDFKLNKNVPYKVDVYKTSIKFEVIQK